VTAVLAQQHAQAIDAGLAMDSVHEVVRHRIGGRVDQLIDHRLTVHQLHDAGLLAGPHVLPAAAQGVLAASKELVKLLEKTQVVFEDWLAERRRELRRRASTFLRRWP